MCFSLTKCLLNFDHYSTGTWHRLSPAVEAGGSTDQGGPSMPESIEAGIRPTTSRRPPVRLAATLLLGLGIIGAVAVQVGTGAQRRQGRPAPPAPKPAVNASAAPQPAASTETVSARPFAHPVRVTGTLKSDEVVALSTKATGMVRQVLAKEGDRVRRGQLLVEIDDSELQAQRARAVATAEAAAARLKQAYTSRGMKNAAVAADYHRAEQALSAARTRLSQARALARISATEVESNVESARSAL
jgi:multidrug efflux pump subunit AcrA (membrane-fusion protein)